MEGEVWAVELMVLAAGEDAVSRVANAVVMRNGHVRCLYSGGTDS
jgi:hypothetical protein